MTIISDFEKLLNDHSPQQFANWRAIDLHNHSPVSYDYQGDRATAVSDTAKHLRQSPIDIVMFTDHEKLPDATFTEEVARQSGKLVLRGAELNIFVQTWSKPEGKVDRNPFFHLLVGFDPDGQFKPDYWFDYLHQHCTNETRKFEGAKIHGFTASVDSICKVLEKAGAIVIPAHLHTNKNAFKSRSVDDIFADPEFLKLARNHFTALEVTDPTTAVFFDGKHAETGNLLKTCIQSSDAHTFDKIGTRFTYVQMEVLTFAELRAALNMPERVSLIIPPCPESYIVGLNITGQFYSNLWLSLSPHCNALIGVKGSGKTSVLECLRFALGAQVPSSRQEDVNNHLQSILGPSGIVRVLVKRADGAKVLVERGMAQREDYKLTFDDDRQNEVKNTAALRFPTYILGWHEIEQAATDPNIRQVYLDTIAGQEQIRQLRETAESSATRVRYLHGQVSNRYQTFRSLSDQIARLEDLVKGLQELNDAQLISLHESYQTAVRQRDAIHNYIDRLKSSAGEIPIKLSTLALVADKLTLEGQTPLKPFADLVLSASTHVEADVTAFATRHQKILEAALQGLEGKQPEIAAAFQRVSDEYAKSLAQLPAEKRRLLEGYRQVMEETRALPRLQSEMGEERRLIEEILIELEAVCNEVATALDACTQLREEKVAVLNEQLKEFSVHLEVAPLARKTAFEQLNNGNGSAIAAALNQMSSDRRHHRKLASGYATLRRNLLDGYSLFFGYAEFLGYLGAFEDDDLKISFAVGKDGEAYSPIDQLSAGQRCTAVFPLLLKMREGPLIVDQPEDNLDNRHIADVIAPALLADKRIRQIAFTSHSANLVVLTDAEHIAMFEATGSKGAVQERGFLCTSDSRITREVISILDGGTRALELRYQKYGRNA